MDLLNWAAENMYTRATTDHKVDMLRDQLSHIILSIESLEGAGKSTRSASMLDHTIARQLITEHTESFHQMHSSLHSAS